LLSFADGNAEADNNDDGQGTMEALYFVSTLSSRSLSFVVLQAVAGPSPSEKGIFACTSPQGNSSGWGHGQGKGPVSQRFFISNAFPCDALSFLAVQLC
jgi:hypothetical protein